MKHSLELLAVPADIQLRELVAFSRTPDEFYLSFNNWRLKSMADFHSEFVTNQLDLLDSMEQIFIPMGNECWTESGSAN
ncbi:MAG: hypothetical protein WAK20_12895, partial [Candidatus Acidiferrum sp.]